MVSCSGFGLPMHAQLLRLFVTYMRAWLVFLTLVWSSLSGSWLLSWLRVMHRYVKRRSNWACIGKPKPEQETIKGTHAQETSAYQRRPTTQHAAQGSNPPVRALYMQLAKIPPTHLTTPPATSAASADQHGTHRGRNRTFQYFKFV